MHDVRIILILVAVVDEHPLKAKLKRCSHPKSQESQCWLRCRFPPQPPRPAICRDTCVIGGSDLFAHKNREKNGKELFGILWPVSDKWKQWPFCTRDAEPGLVEA